MTHSQVVPILYMSGSVFSVFVLSLFLPWSLKTVKPLGGHKLSAVVGRRAGWHQEQSSRDRTGGTAENQTIGFLKPYFFLMTITVLTTSVYGSLNLCWSQVSPSHAVPALLGDSLVYLRNEQPAVLHHGEYCTGAHGLHEKNDLNMIIVEIKRAKPRNLKVRKSLKKLKG